MKFNIKLMPYQMKHIYSKELNLNVTGSAGSGKTIFGAYKTLYFALTQPGSRLLVTRKSGPSLQLTCVYEIMKILNTQGFPYNYNANMGDLSFPNGSVIHFKSIDVLEKFRSITVDYIWVEQAEEIGYKDYQELKRRLRGKAEYLQCLLTFTPEDEYHWIYKLFYQNEKKRNRIVHFHYSENTELPESYIQELEELKEMDPDLWRKYGLGEFGKITDVVYTHFKRFGRLGDSNTSHLIRSTPKGLDGGMNIAGLDWGFNNPNVFLLGKYYEGEYYFTDCIYIKKVTNPEFLEMCNELLAEKGITQRHVFCYADWTEPSKIQEFANKGYNIRPGTNQLEMRIDHVKRSRVNIHTDLDDVWSEQRSYKYATDRDGNVLDKPVPFNDHAMNCIEYVCHGINELLGVRLPIDPYAMAGGEATF